MASPRIVLLTALAIAAASTTAPLAAAAPSADDEGFAAACTGILFDDFDYESAADPRLSGRGWRVRAGGGGPGIGGWSPANVTFPTSAGRKVLQVSAHTDGTAGGTGQAELMHQQKFYEGTYASRVRFADTPVAGSDGDHLVQTFFTITPLRFPNDPAYSELDFEYLPNGGWGGAGPTMHLTSWETYQPDPWVADNTSTRVDRSYAGWHDLVVQVSGGVVTYFIDGNQVARHEGHVYPETPMMIAYQNWFIDLAGHSGGQSSYQQQNDWVYYSANEVLSTSEVHDRVARLRAEGASHRDTAGC